MKTLGILITGSRGFTNFAVISMYMDMLYERFEGDYSITVIEGGAKGTDTLSKDYCVRHGRSYLEFTPDWEKYGDIGGMIRNKDMLDHCLLNFDKTVVLSMWDGSSRGTKQMLDMCEEQGLEIILYKYSPTMTMRDAERVGL